MTYQALIIILSIFVFSSGDFVSATANSICADKRINSMRPCAIYCVGCYPVAAQIAVWLGCGSNPTNECWCSTGLFSLATSGLSSCISESCTLGGWEDDYTNAVGFYTNYCQGAGFTALAAAPVDVPAQPTLDQNTIPVTNAIVVTNTIVESTLITNVATVVADITETSVTTVVTGITETSVTGTETTRIPTSVTMLIYSTFTTILNDTSAAQLAAEWTGARGSSRYEKIAIAVGVVCVVIIIGLIGWIIYLKSRNSILEAMLQGAIPVGGNQEYDPRTKNPLGREALRA